MGDASAGTLKKSAPTRRSRRASACPSRNGLASRRALNPPAQDDCGVRAASRADMPARRSSHATTADQTGRDRLAPSLISRRASASRRSGLRRRLGSGRSSRSYLPALCRRTLGGGLFAGGLLCSRLPRRALLGRALLHCAFAGSFLRDGLARAFLRSSPLRGPLLGGGFLRRLLSSSFRHMLRPLCIACARSLALCRSASEGTFVLNQRKSSMLAKRPRNKATIELSRALACPLIELRPRSGSLIS